MRRLRPTMIVLLLMAAVVGVVTQTGTGAKADPGPDVVEAGYDLLETDSSNSFQNVLLPADFFGPGSDPFDGVVYFQGDPLGSYTPPPGPTYTGLGPTDTIVERRQDAGAVFPDTIEIQIVEMSLVSTAPITVTYNGGQSPEPWEIRAQVPENDVNQIPGDMTIRHEHANGGTFDSWLPVDPLVTFTQLAGPGMVIGPMYYSSITGLDIDYYNAGTPWCHTANPLDTPAGNWVIEKEGLTSNFFGGIDCSTGVGDDLVRDKDYFLRDGLVSDHSVQPAEELETNYECYDIIPPEPLAMPVILETQFGTEEVDVGPAAYLCPPALKNGLGDEFAPHLKCYDILGAGDPDAVVNLETQFGLEEDIEVGTGRLLCMPTVKTPIEPPGQPSGPLVPSPHYECFEITGDAPGIPVTLQTQFRFEEVIVDAATYLCAPAVKNGEGDLDAPHLKCYDVLTMEPPVGWIVQLETQFPPPEIVEVGESQLLCVPAAKEVIADRDGDGVPDDIDNCPDTPNPGQADSDTDGLGDVCDNCPDDYNPGQENADGDAWGDICDNCPAVPTPWEVQPGDGDCDGFTDGEEGNVGTDAADWCPDDPTDDTWPSDYDMNGTCNVLDIVQWTPPYFNTSPPDPNYDTRKDFNGDSAVNILDIVRLTPPMFNTVCVP